MESADHHIAETISLDTGPIVNLVGRDVLRIYGLVRRSPCIGAVSAYDGHELVILVGNGEFGGLVADGIYLMIDCRTCGLVLSAAICLEKRLYLIEHRLLGCVVGRTELLRALEHQVFKIMGQTGGLRRVVLAPDLDRYVGLYTGLFFVDGHEDFQSIVQCVDFGLQRIPLDSFILLSAGVKRQRQHQRRRHE